MIKYKLIEINNIGNISTVIEKTNGQIVSYIPKDLSNADYQAYLNRDELQVEHLTEIPTV